MNRTKKVILIIVAVFVGLGIIGLFLPDDEDEAAEKKAAPEKKTEQKSEKKKTENKQKKEPKESMTMAQKNAYESAKNYLSTGAFSKAGLIDQLSNEYGEGFEKADAEFAVSQLEKNKEVDWVEEAKQSAKAYLETGSFSKDGLIEQLTSDYGDKFTHEQAVAAVEAVYK